MFDSPGSGEWPSGAPETVDPVIPADHPMSKYRYVFVGGLHRSGTTLLFRILRDHPHVSGFRVPGGAEREHEGQFHQTVYAPGEKTGGPGYFCLNPDSALEEQNPLATRENAERIFEEWGKLWDLSKPYLLEKSPPNLIRTRFLQRLFPNSYFIIIARHPVAASLATIKWMGWPRFLLEPEHPDDPDSVYTVRRSSKADNQLFYRSRKIYTESMLYTLFEHWTLGYSRYESDAAHLARCLTLRYEDLVRDPDGTLESVYRFLGLPVPETRRDYEISDQNARYFDQWEMTPETELAPSCRSYLVERYEPYFSRFGYSLNNVRHLQPMRTPIPSPNH